MKTSNLKIIDLQDSDWSEVTPPTIAVNQPIKSLVRLVLRQAAVGVTSAAIGFVAYDLGQDIDLDFDYEHPELSTTANIATEELARIEMSDSVTGYRISVAHNMITDDRMQISDGHFAYLDVRKR